MGSGIEMLEACVDNVLAEVEAKRRYTSIVIPMLGTGEGGLSVNEVARPLISRAIEFFKRYPGAKLAKIYFIPYSAVDAETVKDAVQSLESAFEPLEDEAASVTDRKTAG